MGKKSPAPPPAPDYTGAAIQQGQANLEAARLSARLSNPNVSTPLGGQRVTFGRQTLDQPGYDKAMAEYNKQLEAYNAAKASGQAYKPPTGAPTMEFDPETGRYIKTPGVTPGIQFDESGMPIAPTKEGFTRIVDPDTPFIEQYLTPEAQATLEAQQRVERALSGLGEKAIGKVSDIYGSTFTPQGLPQQQFQFGGYGQLPTLGDLGAMGQFQRGVTPEAMAGVPDITAMGRAGGGPAAPGQIVGADLSGVGGVQRGVDVGGLAQLPVGAGATGQEAIMSRLQPQLQRERAQLETQLRNQGLVPGGEAYNAEVQLFNQRANDAMQQAALQGINLDAQMRAQGFSERQIQAQLANQAQQQAFQQQLASGAFGREGQQLAFQMGQSAQQAQNQALAQNQAAAMQAYQAQLARQAQGFGQQMDVAGLYNAALAAQQQSALQQAQAQAALQAQGFNQAQAAAAFQNAQRQAALQEQLALRAQPLNEIAAIMGGAQVQMPQFQAYQGADVAAAPIFGATQAAGQFAQQNYANQVAARNAQLGLYGDLFGTIGGLAGGNGIKGLIG